MKMMAIGSGGREYALAWKLARSPKVQMVHVAPGNDDTVFDKRLRNLPITDPEVLAASAECGGTHFTVVGPEAPLVAGTADLLRAKGLCTLGPIKVVAQLESSKNFAKAFMHRHGIPTAKYQTFSDTTQAHAYTDQGGAPIVVKADGLIAGKGVVVTMMVEEAHSAVGMMLADNHLGDAGIRVVIEEFPADEEASSIVVCNGKNVVTLATSQDHKYPLDGDAGPNTGGTGVYLPTPVVASMLHARAPREIIMPVIRSVEKDGIPYTGFLYAGLVVDTEDNPKTLEFNCRMDDPEAQPIMACMKTDPYDVLGRTVDGKLDGMELDWDRRTTLGVVMAAHSYPDMLHRGDVIIGIPKKTEDSVTFYAGTMLRDDALTTNGGRVLCVVDLTDTIKAVQRATYNAIRQVHSDGAWYRIDVGHHATRH